MISKWPEYDEALCFEADEKKMEIVMNAISEIRNIRTQMNVVPSKKAKVIVVAEDVSLFEGSEIFFEKLASASETVIQSTKDGIDDNAVTGVVEGAELFIPMDELVDREKELARLNDEKKRLEGEIKRVEGKLNNQGFVAKAPEKVVAEEREKGEKYKQMLEKVLESIEKMK